MTDRPELNFTSKISSFRLKPKQKRPYAWTQRFRESWKEEFSWVEQADNGNKDAFCIVCCKFIRCKKDDLVKHDRGKKHRENMTSASRTQPPQSRINLTDQAQSIKIGSVRSLACSKSDQSCTLICGIDVAPEIDTAVAALRSKLDALSSELLGPSSAGQTMLCTRSMDHVLDVLTKLKSL